MVVLYVIQKVWVQGFNCVSMAAGPVPEPNTWEDFLPALRLTQECHVALPCCGIDGAGFALKAMRATDVSNNVYDLESRYREHLQSMIGEGSPLHLGKKAGDIVPVPLSEWERPVHVVVSGPPCPPWAGNGNRGGADDPRAQVFLAIVLAVAAFAKCGELQAAVLENVLGIMHKQRGEESFMSKLLGLLREEVPEFIWNVETLKARQYMLAQDRTRVFLRGIRKSLCPSGEIPPVLEPFGERTLRDFLAAGLPSVNRKELTKCMAQNLQDSQAQLRKLLNEGEISEDSLVCYPLDRADDKTYKRQICVDRTPTLTTSNTYLFVSDMRVDAKDEDRRFFRFLLPEERLVLQGFPKSICNSLQGHALQVKAAGNAYPVPLIAAALHGLMDALQDLPAPKPDLDFPVNLNQRLQEAMFGTGKEDAKTEKASKTRKRPAAAGKMKRPAASASGHEGESKKEEGEDPSASGAASSSKPATQRSAAVAKPSPKKKAKTKTVAAVWRMRGFLSDSSSSS